MSASKISFIGAGNVAEALAMGFARAGHVILSVSSKHGENARALAHKTGAGWRRDLSVPEGCDLVIIAVNDSSVEEVAAALDLPESTAVVHTAASVPLSSLGRDVRAGVFYPLQTFTKGSLPALTEVPFFVEATDGPTLDLLLSLGRSIGSGAWVCDSERRRQLHVAAVFVNNFSNFMMTTGGDLAKRAGFDPEIMRPLIAETARKALLNGPAASQTGPAVRDDVNTVKNHAELLSFSPEYRELYLMISRMITDYYKKNS